MSFDIKEFMYKYGVDYKEHGKNIGVGWIGVRECPFCGGDGYHFGIKQGGFSCWKCGVKGNATKFVKQVLNVSWAEAIAITGSLQTDEEEFERVVGNKVILPSNMIDVNEKGLEYLESRGFGQETVEKYQLKQCIAFSKVVVDDMKSDFAWRIFIPIYMRKQLVSYTARDYTGQREPRYKHPFLEACIIPASSTIYNMDTVKDRCIVLEGPTDVWRMGDECVSLQGIEYTKRQVRYLVEMNLEKVVIMFDTGKEDKAEDLAGELCPFIPVVRVAKMEFGDPGELSPMEAVKIKCKLLRECV